MLKINNLAKSFGRINALSNINPDISNGEFYGLLEPNSAGKSTLMNIITLMNIKVGYLQADSGTVSINGDIIKYQKITLMNSN